ncbi:hypothetical protein BH11PSE13_BH11PSE13_34180 [soil metagenome]
MIRTNRLCLLLWLATLAAPALASYRDGDLGTFLVLLSLPVAAAAFVLALLMAILGLFRKDAVFWVFATVVCLAALGVVAQCAGDPESVRIALLGEAALFAAVLLPGIVQYARRSKTQTIQDARPQRDTE